MKIKYTRGNLRTFERAGELEDVGDDRDDLRVFFFLGENLSSSTRERF
jgi:hypothetical protein